MADEKSVAVAGIIERYSGDRDMLIPMMQDLQEECGYLPQQELKGLSRALGVPLSRLYGIATFYASFRLMPKGDHTIQLCMGTVCFLKGAERISEAIRKEFELVPGGTSPDGRFTYSPVNCLGACALAPVMVVDGEYHGGLTVDSAVELLHKVAEGGNGGGEAASKPDTTSAEPEESQPPADRRGGDKSEAERAGKKRAAAEVRKGGAKKTAKKARKKGRGGKKK